MIDNKARSTTKKLAVARIRLRFLSFCLVSMMALVKVFRLASFTSVTLITVPRNRFYIVQFG